MNAPLPASAFDVDEAVAPGGCAVSVSRMVLNGNVVIEIECSKEERVRLDYEEVTGGRRSLQAQEITIVADRITITAPHITLVGNVRIKGDCHVDGTLHAQDFGEWTPE